MKTFTLLVLVVAAVIGMTNAGEKARFDNYRVYSLNIQTKEQLDLMHEIENRSDGYLFWNAIDLNRNVDLMVSPHKLAEFSEIMELMNIENSLKVENVQTLIDNERPKIKSRAWSDWTDYQTFDEISQFLDEKLAANPTILTGTIIGQTYQNRPIRAVKLSYKAGNPAIFIEANIHAREWITSATATWWLNELLTSTEPEIVDLAQNIDWFIIPVFNVDGFVYSHEVNRMWRKTRQNHAHLCYGTDANRNFDFNWMVNNGASSNPCSETYAGPAPFSEPETVALARYIEQNAAQIKLYVSFHSYGQYILFPYGHSVEVTPHHDIMQSIGAATVAGFEKRNEAGYVVGTTAGALYVASGISVDWAYGVQNITVGYTFEFRDIRGGQYGFVLPADQIIPNCLETKDGILAMVEEARRLSVL